MKKTLQVDYHKEDNFYWATFPELYGWSCVGDTIEEVKDRVSRGILRIGECFLSREYISLTETPIKKGEKE